MDVRTVTVGILEENCYIIRKNDKCLIIDPGDEANSIKKIVGNNKVEGILITHYHNDHIGALEEIKETYQAQVYDIYNLKEGTNKIGNFIFDMIITKGHKEDAVTYYFKPDIMFTGDFIFRGTIGRIDLPGGNEEEMKQSIKKILTYNKNITIYPGHGGITTLEKETGRLEHWIKI